MTTDVDCPACAPDSHSSDCMGPRHYYCPKHRAQKLARECLRLGVVAFAIENADGIWRVGMVA